jgi:hypothetical protein
MAMLTDIRYRGVNDVFFLVCDGLKGLPDAVGNVWPLATVQTCIIRLIPNTFRLASKRDWDALRRDIKAVYTAVARPQPGTPWTRSPRPGAPATRRPPGCGTTPGSSSLDHPGNPRGCETWEDAGSWWHSGSIRRSCVNAR